MPTRIQKIDSIITDTCSKKEITLWSDIVEAISSQMDINNWMEVRGVLQFQIDEGEIAKTSNIFEEEYIKL